MNSLSAEVLVRVHALLAESKWARFRQINYCQCNRSEYCLGKLLDRKEKEIQLYFCCHGFAQVLQTMPPTCVGHLTVHQNHFYPTYWYVLSVTQACWQKHLLSKRK